MAGKGYTVITRKSKKKNNGKVYVMVVYLGLKTGKYRNKWVSLNARNKTEAHKEAALRYAELVAHKEQSEPKKSKTFNEILDLFENQYMVITDLSKQTVEGYQRNIRLHIRPGLGEFLVDELRPHLGEFYASKREEGYSPTTVLQFHRIIHKALEYAAGEGIIPINVAHKVEHPSKSKDQKGKALDEAELAMVLKELEKSPEEISCLPAQIAAWTGMRIGEILGLSWANVDFAAKTISVTQSMKYTKEGPVLGPPKSASGKRTLPILPDLLHELRKEKEKQTKNRLSWGSAYCSDLNLVCCRANGSPLNRSTVSKNFSLIAEKAEIKMRFHDLRHTFATLLIHAGVSLDIVKYLLGHSSITTTVDTYTHTPPGITQQIGFTLKQIRSEVVKYQTMPNIPLANAKNY